MPLNEIPNHFSPETRSLIEAALDDAWRELSKEPRIDATLARSKLRTTIVALAAVGETDLRRLKWFAIHAWRGAMQADQVAIARHARMSGTAATGNSLITPAAGRA
jgi:hypothetical protein